MNYRISMPRGGEDGVIILARSDQTIVEFRGRPYSQWDIGENTPMYRLHASLVRTDISRLHSGFTEVITPWHSEWKIVKRMHDEAISEAF